MLGSISMHYKNIWDFAEQNQIDLKRREKRYIKVAKEDFEYIRPHFKERFNILRPKYKSYRTREKFFHLHAIEKKQQVEIHLDLMNVDRLRMLSFVPHALFDVIPFLLVRILVFFFMILALPKYIGKGFLKFYKYVRNHLGT